MNARYRIFAASNPVGAGPPRPSRGTGQAPRACASSPAPVALHPLDREFIRVLDQAPAHGESLKRAFDRKEAELRALFITAPSSECSALHARLCDEETRTESSERLRLLTAERRGRVLGYLVECSRRRAA